MRRRIPLLLLSCALAALARAASAAGAKKPAAAPPPQEPAEVYKSPSDYARAGDFEFRYPKRLLVLQDFVYLDASVEGPLHTVVLRDRDAEAGDLRSIEINALRSLKQKYDCRDYSVCRVVDGVVIGTNSEDPDFAKALDAVANSFKRR